MEVQEKLKNIRTFVFICFAIAIIEMVFGLTIMYAGLLYKEFDKESAQEMLDIIKESNIDYYEKLMSTSDRSYMQEFEKIYSKKGNKSLTVPGIIIIIFSVFSLIPVILIMFTIKGKKEEPVQEEEPGEEEEEPVQEEEPGEEEEEPVQEEEPGEEEKPPA